MARFDSLQTVDMFLCIQLIKAKSSFLILLLKEKSTLKYYTVVFI